MVKIFLFQLFNKTEKEMLLCNKGVEFWIDTEVDIQITFVVYVVDSQKLLINKKLCRHDV